MTSAMMSDFGLPLRLMCRRPEYERSKHKCLGVHVDIKQHHKKNVTVTDETNVLKDCRGYFDNTDIIVVAQRGSMMMHFIIGQCDDALMDKR